MEVKIGLSKKAMSDVCEGLQDYLATTYALYLKTQNYHWNVKGPQFIALHLLFQKQYEELAEAVDEIAERITSLGHHANGSFLEFHKRSQIKEPKKKATAHQMLKELVEGHETLSAMGRPLIPFFQELEDEASADMLIKRLGIHEKAAWLLRSHLE